MHKSLTLRSRAFPSVTRHVGLAFSLWCHRLYVGVHDDVGIGVPWLLERNQLRTFLAELVRLGRFPRRLSKLGSVTSELKKSRRVVIGF
jgi:hypothetical protein